MTDMDQPVQKRRKISLACIQCRERKVRCSGERPECASCRRRSTMLPSNCSYAIQDDSSADVTQSIQILFDKVQRLEDLAALSADTEGQACSKLVAVRTSDEAYGEKRSARNNATKEDDSNLASDDFNFFPTPLSAHSDKEHADRMMTITNGWRLSSTDLGEYRQPLASASSQLSNGHAQGQTDSFATSTSRSGTSQVSSRIGEDLASAADAMGTSSNYEYSSPESSQYYGASSGIAFMRGISKVLEDSTGIEELGTQSASPASLNNPGIRRRDGWPPLLNRLSAIESAKGLPDYFTLPPKSISDHLLENYWTRAYPLYPVLHRPTFEAAYSTLWTSTISDADLAIESNAGLGNKVDAGPSTQVFYCSLNMMLALGSQFAELSAPRRKDLITMFQQRSSDLLVVDMMDRGSIAVVQALLLTGQYFQSTLHPQRCWNSIGVACRIAQGLGLHVEEFPRKSEQLGLEMRRRVWYGCVLLDISGSMTMGRPLMISHQYNTNLPSEIGSERLQATASAKILAIVLTTVYDRSISQPSQCTNVPSAGKIGDNLEPPDLKAIIELSKRLVKFENELPTGLRWGQGGDSLPRSLGITGSKLKMQSNFLHARLLQTRILLYRDSFMRLCQASLSESQELDLDNLQNLNLDFDSLYMKNCAASCAISAKDLLELIHSTSHTKDTDAWWYNVYFAHTSGMVVKLAQLCEPLNETVSLVSLEKSWHQCREILLRLAEHAPLAQRCLDSLEALQEKILQRKKKKETEQSSPQQTGSMQNVSPGAPNITPLSFHLYQQVGSSERPNKRRGGQQHMTRRTKLNGLQDSGMPSDNPTVMTNTEMNSDQEEASYWPPTDIQNLWNFPGVDFEFDFLA